MLLLTQSLGKLSLTIIIEIFHSLCWSPNLKLWSFKLTFCIYLLGFYLNIKFESKLLNFTYDIHNNILTRLLIIWLKSKLSFLWKFIDEKIRVMWGSWLICLIWLLIKRSIRESHIFFDIRVNQFFFTQYKTKPIRFFNLIWFFNLI